jgi:hypothetical protein
MRVSSDAFMSLVDFLVFFANLDMADVFLTGLDQH